MPFSGGAIRNSERCRARMAQLKRVGQNSPAEEQQPPVGGLLLLPESTPMGCFWEG